MVKKKKEAQVFLEQIEKDTVKIECKLIERKQWEELALSITAATGGERVQSSSVSKSRMSDAVDRCVDAEGEIDDAVAELVAHKKKAVQVIEQVDNATWYKILHMKYIQFKNLRTIGDEMNRDYDWVKTTHGRALERVQKILDAEKLGGA